jgi:uncharacterized membrane protein YfcA
MDKKKSIIISIITGAPIGCLGGLIGLGGAEFRLPFLIGLFKKSAYQSVALNLAVSLITILSSLIFRVSNVDINTIKPLWIIMLSLLAGSMTGAYFGAFFSKKITENFLKKIILLLLVSIGILLIAEGLHPFVSSTLINYTTILIIIIGLCCGLAIGFISSLLGVAGGELIIPTLILIFGVDVKIAGTASLLISLPTIIIGIIRHFANSGYSKKDDITNIVIPMGIASIIGAFIGTVLIIFVPSQILKIILGFILIISSIKIFIKKNLEENKTKLKF